MGNCLHKVEDDDNKICSEDEKALLPNTGMWEEQDEDAEQDHFSFLGTREFEYDLFDDRDCRGYRHCLNKIIAEHPEWFRRPMDVQSMPVLDFECLKSSAVIDRNQDKTTVQQVGPMNNGQENCNKEISIKRASDEEPSASPEKTMQSFQSLRKEKESTGFHPISQLTTPVHRKNLFSNENVTITG